ncbi:hypothetical protein K503DRAFT_806368 [Rhizopogon vinicolor AM-OR11-026]|uniref:Uncharacterized protein n=1 Tax=Rhizopogon vinicolor AM-OR11-026 TaxID=1314800 RepID=A0A1B7MES9_9AGAM|nr:hypothetical protein K503DRAFT_806368 [Rhizopogon vinicolor AM-OR11-026]
MPYDHTDRLLELVEDACIAWPTEAVVQAAQRAGQQVLRFHGWAQPVVDELMYARERPRDNSRDEVYVFGPEGETGVRSAGIFQGRRRRGIWETVLKLLGMFLMQKVALELSNVPGLR